LNLQHCELESDRSTLDQLHALIADAMGQPSADRQGPPTMDAESLDNGLVPLPQGIINAIIARLENRHGDGNPTHEAVPDDPEMMVGKENTPAGGQAKPSPSTIATSTGHAEVSQTIENTTAVGQTQAAAKDPLFQTAVAGGSSLTGQTDERQAKENPLDSVVKEKRIEEGIKKGEAHFLFKPVAADGDEGETNTNRFIQERLPSGMRIPEKATRTGTTQSPIVAADPKDPTSMATALTDQEMTSSKDEAANLPGKDRHNPTQRVELADVNEDELQNGQSSDSVKSTIPDQSKSHPSFQDTAKALAGDQSTNMALKPTTGPAASVRPEESAVKLFQTTVMDQIVDKAAMRSIHGRSEIQIRLKPEFLGNVQMNIASDKEQLVVRIMTDRPIVKEIIETHLHHLKTELQNQGLTIDKFEVVVNPDANQQHSREQFAQMFKHHSSQNGRRQPHEQDPETLNRGGGNNSDDDRLNRDGVNYFA
jgi:flagellar hook-length control protein FliK